MPAIRYGVSIELPSFRPGRPRANASLPFTATPPAVSLVCVETGEASRALLNPDRLPETYAMGWAQVLPHGADHPELQFTGSQAAEFDLDLLYSRDVWLERWPGRNPDVDAWKAFLLQFTAPLDRGNGFVGGAPPRLLVSWPRVLTVMAVVTRLEFDNQRFAADTGEILTVAARLSLQEARTRRWTSSDMRAFGGRRADAGRDTPVGGTSPRVVVQGR